jgi:hypothetical protein
MTTLTINTSLAGVADTTAPTLSEGATSVVSTTAWTGVITTNEGNGTIYTLVNSSSSATAAAVKSGGTALPVSSAGQKNLSFPGLTPDTSGYYAHIMHEDAATNQSPVTSIGPFATPDAGAGTGTVSIDVLREGDARGPGGERLSPYPAWLEVQVSDGGLTEPTNPMAYDYTQRDFAYVIDRGYGNNDPYDFLTHVPDHLNNRTKTNTKQFFCCFPPGTHTVTVTVYRHDGTLVGSATKVYTISDPVSVIPAADTYVISNSGTDDGGITGANKHTTLLSAMVASTGKTQTCLYLYKRGQTHQFNSRITLTKNNYDSIIGAVGSGTDPLITSTLSGSLFEFSPQNGGSTGNFIFQSLRFQGGWNPLTESGQGTRLFNRSINKTLSNRKITLIDKCQFENFSTITSQTSGNDNPHTSYAFAIHNSRYESAFTGFGIWMTANAGAFMAIQGTKLFQLPEAPTGGPNGSHHYGCYRTGGTGLFVHDCSEFFSGGTKTDQMLLQPTCRLFTAPGEHAVKRNTAVITGCYFDGGGSLISIPNSGGSDLSPTNKNQGCQVFITHSIFVSQTYGIKAINTSQAGIEVVNCVFLHANAKTNSLYPHGGGWKGFLVGDSGGFSGSSGRDTTSPVRFHYCNFISKMTNANLKGTPQLEDNMNQFGGQLTLANNIVSHVHTSGPNTAGVTFTSDLMQMNGDDWQPIFDRVRHKATSSRPAINDTSFATAPGQLPDCRVTAAPVATGDRVLFDFYNNQRPATTRVGAVGQLTV